MPSIGNAKTLSRFMATNAGNSMPESTLLTAGNVDGADSRNYGAINELRDEDSSSIESVGA